MKQVCPHCQSADVYEMTGYSDLLKDGFASPAILIPLSISLCRSLNINPGIGVVVGSALVAVIKQVRPEQSSIPLLNTSQYRCNHCSYVFHRFN